MTCDRCENQAAYTRKYSGKKLCSQCFSKSIVKKTAVFSLEKLDIQLRISHNNNTDQALKS